MNCSDPTTQLGACLKIRFGSGAVQAGVRHPGRSNVRTAAGVDFASALEGFIWLRPGRAHSGAAFSNTL